VKERNIKRISPSDPLILLDEKKRKTRTSALFRVSSEKMNSGLKKFSFIIEVLKWFFRRNL
jgi:hypothetical protein